MTPYQVKKQKRRTLISFLIAILLHFFLLGAFLLYDYFFIEDLSEFSGPILVKLGEPVGEDLPILPEKTKVEEPADPVENTPASVLEDLSPDIADAPQALPIEKAVTPVLPEKPISSDKPVPNVASTPVKDSKPTPEVVTPAEPVPVTIKGEEDGNSYEYQFLAEEGVIGRSFATEISLYMPLPQFISPQIYERMTGDSYRIGLKKQDLLRQYYRNVNGEWAYDQAPPTDDIRALWSYLKDAGYDSSRADYKAGRNLKPVVISFTISGTAELLMSKIDKSSGDTRVDNSVLEGFRSATFSNSSDRKINGRFTYRFE